MLDQSFSADNFRKIFDLENRRGNYLEGKYFPKLKRLRQKVQEGSRELWNFRRRKNLYTSEEYQYLKSKASEKLATRGCGCMSATFRRAPASGTGWAPAVLPHHAELAGPPAVRLRDRGRPHRQHPHRGGTAGQCRTGCGKVPERPEGDRCETIQIS